MDRPVCTDVVKEKQRGAHRVLFPRFVVAQAWGVHGSMLEQETKHAETLATSFTLYLCLITYPLSSLPLFSCTALV